MIIQYYVENYLSEAALIGDNKMPHKVTMEKLNTIGVVK